MTSHPAADAPSHVYYFQVGTGTWHGSFAFRVTSWSRLRSGAIGWRNTLLVVVMQLSQWATGKSRLESTIIARPTAGAFGEADNTVRLSRFGVTQYLLRERYVLDPDGTRVTVHAKEQFGPVPGILSRSFSYPAEIHPGGMSSTYHMPLLGDQWTASYQVTPDHNGLSGHLVSGWATATEQVRRVTTDSGPAAA
jgi:hypothetical protein